MHMLPPFIAELNDSTVQSLGILRDRMKTAKPRCLDLNLLNTFVLMTDAAFDPSKGAGLGCSTCVAYRISRMLVWHSIVAKELEFTAWEGQADSDW